MVTTLLDCYTDEPSGLGVPPYLGTYPRYLYGSLKGKCNYITIDDLRNYAILNKLALKTHGETKAQLEKRLQKKIKEAKLQQQQRELKTDIKIKNLTKDPRQVKEIIRATDTLIVIGGVHTPGTYLSALPGTLFEINEFSKLFRAEKILTGPAIFGTRLEGGKPFETDPLEGFKIDPFMFSYREIDDHAVTGASILNQIPDLRILEIETSRGCTRRKGCSFCTEPIKNRYEYRSMQGIIAEVKELCKNGALYFRLGKQSSFYAHPDAVAILKTIRKQCPKIKVLHIDNVDPMHVIHKRGEQITEAIARYCTPGNIAAFGVESFDTTVIKENNLIVPPESVLKAIRIINKYGAKPGDNGLPAFLPGLNLLFGLKGETKKTHDENMKYLRQVLSENLMFRRLNIRQVTLFEGTPLFKDPKGTKALKRNKRYYWKWRNQIRNEIDLPMLKRILPEGTLLKDVRMEVYHGNTTFGRQIGSYPLVVGVKKRLELGKFYSIRVTGHMLRSVTGEAV